MGPHIVLGIKPAPAEYKQINALTFFLLPESIFDLGHFSKIFFKNFPLLQEYSIKKMFPLAFMCAIALILL